MDRENLTFPLAETNAAIIPLYCVQSIIPVLVPCTQTKNKYSNDIKAGLCRLYLESLERGVILSDLSHEERKAYLNFKQQGRELSMEKFNRSNITTMDSRQTQIHHGR